MGGNREPTENNGFMTKCVDMVATGTGREHWDMGGKKPDIENPKAGENTQQKSCNGG